MNNASYSGEKFGGNFRTDGPTPSITGLRNRSFAAARIIHGSVEHGESQIPAQAAVVLAYVMNRGIRSSELRVGGRPIKCDPVRPGQIRYYDLQQGVWADLRDPLDFIYMYLPIQALNEFNDEHGLPKIGGCSINTGAGFSDPFIAQIACSLLPAFSQFGRENQLFIDETAFRLQSHFVFRYAGLSSGRALFRGGLTPRQEQRVKDFMLAHAASTVSVESLANECGLSRSQFFRAFKYTTGKTPHQWLIQCRVEMSKELLLASERPLAEIARLCGFTNPSHFTRVFSTYVGTAPGAWRIARLS